MRWPADHPAVVDPALAPWAAEVDRICPEAEVVRVLRHLPGRRVSTLVRLPDGEAVLKVYATSRARGGHRRLSALARGSAGPVVPQPIGHRKGHVALLEFVHGTPLDRLDDERFVEASALAGAALRTIHDSGVVLDRTWTIENEISQLRRTAGETTRQSVEEAIRRWTPPRARPMVPSHRDWYPAQAVLTETGVRFIDLDDAAMAPPGLDVGNFLAHLELERRPPTLVADVAHAFLDGYGEEPADLECWRRLSVARLAALAETRHRHGDRLRALVRLLEDR